jgi:hypothetical protein
MLPFIRLPKASSLILSAALATLAAVSLTTAAQAIMIVPGLSVSPNPAPAEKPFMLNLLGVPTDCRTSFGRESVTVIDKRINLTYTSYTAVTASPVPLEDGQKLPAPILPACPDQANPPDITIPPVYDVPAFQMPALKPGTYEVFATMMPECMFAIPGCLVAPMPASAGTLVVEATAPHSYSINPIRTAPAKEFELSLLSYQFNCGTTFDNLSVNVLGNEITLTFLDHPSTKDSGCVAVYKPYGPTFKVPALKTGTYKVTSYRLPACYPCKLVGETAPAGTLTVTGDVVRKGWFLKSAEALAEKPFTLQLLNYDYGNCQTSFSHKSISTQAGGIYTSFLIETRPDIVCIQDVRPYGPVFEMQGLKAGVYPIHVTEQIPCLVNPPFCDVMTPAPVLFDTLIVTKTLSTLLSDLRARSPKADLRGSRAAMVLPEGIGGTWKAELLAVNGSRLASATVNAEGGTSAEFEMGLKPERGVYLMRLSAPDGETHMIPLIRKE